MTGHKRPDNPAQEDWIECPPGALRQMSSRLRSARRRRTVNRVGAVAVLLVTVGVGGYAGMQYLAAPQPVSHAESIALLPDFVEGKLDTALAARVEAHLQQCGVCRKEHARLAGVTLTGRSLPRDTNQHRATHLAAFQRGMERRVRSMHHHPLLVFAKTR